VPRELSPNAEKKEVYIVYIQSSNEICKEGGRTEDHVIYNCRTASRATAIPIFLTRF